MMVTKTLNFEHSNIQVKDFIMGSGDSYEGPFRTQFFRVFGLGRGPFSVKSQLYARAFSFCVVSLGSEKPSSLEFYDTPPPKPNQDGLNFVFFKLDNNQLIFSTKEGTICLSFAEGNSALNVIGSNNLQGTLLTYDLVNENIEVVGKGSSSSSATIVAVKRLRGALRRFSFIVEGASSPSIVEGASSPSIVEGASSPSIVEVSAVTMSFPPLLLELG
ncbi:hypothetical protein JHK87_010032 [Glycine soja]|nr:hypothetical protein JHK87_010032 [Glycine soja]